MAERLRLQSLPRKSAPDIWNTLREAMCRLIVANESTDQHVEPDSESDLVDRLLAEYRAFNVANHDLMARPFTGTSEVLTELRHRGYKIAVVTSKGRELALRGLKLFSLDQLFDSAVFLEDTNFHKPRPEPILAALEKLNVSPSAAVYVGDSPHDIVAGRAAGVRSLAALWGPATRLELELVQPDYVADSIFNLLDIFKHRGSASRLERTKKDVAGCQV